MSTPLNRNEGTRISNPQGLEVEHSQLKNELFTSFHNLEPSMGQALMKEVPKLKEWPHFSEDYELPDRLVTERFNTLFIISAHRWYFKLRQAHGHQSWTWWKTQIINKLANDAWRFEVLTAIESAKFNADKDKALPWSCQQKDRLTAFYPDCNNHSPGVRVFINTPTQAPQISRSTICIRIQFQQPSLLKHAYNLVLQYSLPTSVQVGFTQYSCNKPA
ncbi:hypothetical protein O181_116506 [Austropuccinia psidii MF-1]|uniref:Uncharacterized protein n=1 Tax=Austropuccinia psidii MF-1 TaxID=1389203 RepID=A0A9Q3KAW2_9BASI|nr:hypothetical protein [Austropuccinia psidii MF-1]